MLLNKLVPALRWYIHNLFCYPVAPLIPGELRVFPLSEQEAERTWVSEKP